MSLGKQPDQAPFDGLARAMSSTSFVSLVLLLLILAMVIIVSPAKGQIDFTEVLARENTLLPFRERGRNWEHFQRCGPYFYLSSLFPEGFREIAYRYSLSVDRGHVSADGIFLDYSYDVHLDEDRDIPMARLDVETGRVHLWISSSDLEEATSAEGCADMFSP